MIVKQADLAIAKNKEYTLSFDAYGEEDKTIKAQINGESFEANTYIHNFCSFRLNNQNFFRHYHNICFLQIILLKNRIAFNSAFLLKNYNFFT